MKSINPIVPANIFKRFVKLPLFADKILKIEILSAGYDDPGGRNSIIKVDGIDYSKNKRGYNVVELSGTSGEVIKNDVLEVHEVNGAIKMTGFMDSIEDSNIVLISAQDEASDGMTTQAEKTVYALGAITRLVLKNGKDDVRFRGSFALVTRKDGEKPTWFAEKAADHRNCLLVIEIEIAIAFS